jgi:hypothetical protein
MMDVVEDTVKPLFPNVNDEEDPTGIKLNDPTLRPLNKRVEAE